MGIGLRRKLAERFEVFLLDEFRTSKLHHLTEEVCEHLYVPDRSLEDPDRKRKIHAVLTYKMGNGRYGCINRDRNAVKNMRKIVNYYLATGQRPERYCRDYDLEAQPTIETNRLSNGSNSEGTM